MSEPRPGSVTSRLLRALVGPMIAVALIFGAGGTLVIKRIVEQVNDRPLEASVTAIADTLAVYQGQVTLDLPPAAFGLLEDAERDNVYYNITRSGTLITGYSDLPLAPTTTIDDVTFRYIIYRDQRIRIAETARRLPRIEEPIVVQVGETLEGRHALVRQLLFALGALEISLISLTAILVPAAVRWGLRPLRRIEAAAQTREAVFTPLPIDQAPHEVRSLIVAFNALLKRLESATDGIRRFTADASHQFRTPVAVMRTNIATLERSIPDNDDAKERFADLDASAARLQRLLEQLLSLARAENATAAELQPVDLEDLSRQLAMDHAPRALSAGQDVHFSGPPAPLMVMANPFLIAEIAGNLLDNAVRYAGPNATITVRVEEDDQYGVLTISDDGPGVPAEFRERMGQRFMRVGGDRDAFGSGLGLSIADRLAKAMHGQLSISHGDKGLSVSLRLPLASH